MNSIVMLGKFERVQLTTAWPTEDGNFTPWLAEPGVIGLLGDALRMGLEVEVVEYRVGSFFADILARSTNDSDHRVVIENQFGRTDHRHLGQILTYLAGIEGAKTIVWIAETIQPDHRAAIDWLNTNTAEEFSFFAIEIELWRIDDSAPAPRFNVIASPNDWTKSTRSAARRLGEGELGDGDRARLSYWASYAEFLQSRKSHFSITRPNKDHWFYFPIGRKGFQICAKISTHYKWVCVELYIENDVDASTLRALSVHKDAIEREFGETLDWQELPTRRATRVALFRHGVDPADEGQRQELHSWMLDKMDAFRRVFRDRVRALVQAPVDVAEDAREE